MRQLPSELDYVSFLHYSPQGSSEVSERSRAVTRAVKNDQTLGGFRVISLAASRIREQLHDYPFLADCFGDDVTLVPAPRSSPLISVDSKQDEVKEVLWPAWQICFALMSEKLGCGILNPLFRAYPVRKAAGAPSGKRPDPRDHYDSVNVVGQRPLEKPRRLTLIDDVVTRGSSFVGIVPRLEEAFPGVPITPFALIRTRSGLEVEEIIQPVRGTITFDEQRSVLHRFP